jgi:hypothetical protein
MLGFVVVVVFVVVIAIGGNIFSDTMLTPAEFSQHWDDSDKHCLSGLALRGVKHSANNERVLNRPTLKSRSSGDFEETTPIGVCPFTVTLRDVLWNRLWCPKQLISGMPVGTLQAFRQSVRLRDIFQRDAVNVKFFVTELHYSLDDDNDNDNRCAIASLTTTFKTLTQTADFLPIQHFPKNYDIFSC